MSQNENLSIPRWEQKLNSYSSALNRLAQVVNESKCRVLNEFELDSVVQRFEFTHEVAWKLMKSYAEYQGDDTIAGSRDATRWAFENHLIEDGATWMNMIRSRNDTSHQYDESVAMSVISEVVDHFFPAFLQFHQKMSKIATSRENDIFSQD